MGPLTENIARKILDVTKRKKERKNKQTNKQTKRPSLNMSVESTSFPFYEF